MILLLGKTGYISKRFQDYFDFKKIDYKVVSIKDLPNAHHVGLVIAEHNPDFVINAMGYTGNPNVDACETNKEECLYVNVVLAEVVADYCKKYRIPLGHISTGCLYKELDVEWWYTFDEKVAPNFSFVQKNCSWYSGTKALGESIVRKTWEETYIWRLRMPFNHIEHPKNYISKLLKYPKVWNWPNSITNLDEFVMWCTVAIEGRKVSYGTYNMVNTGQIDAKTILKIAGEEGICKLHYEYFESLEELKTVAPNPRSDCALSPIKALGQHLFFKDIEESVRITMRNWNKPNEHPFWH